MPADRNPTDHARTTQPRAGEWFKNARDLPGLAMIAVSVLGVVVCLAAAAYERTGWAVAAGVVAILAGTAAAVWLFVESRRLRRVEAGRTNRATRRLRSSGA